MSDVLLLGGTGWLSARIAEGWLARGARVTCLARGGRPAPDGAELVVADRGESGAYDVLAGRTWDEVVDVSSDPVAVSAAVEALGERARHWTYVSSISVYTDVTEPDADESAALAEPLEPGEEYDYPRAKAAAELAVRGRRGPTAVIRPGLIVGPGDPSDRFGYWPARFALAGDGPVLVPVLDGASSQVIDVDDLAPFLVDVGSRGWEGTADAVGPSIPLAGVLDTARRLAGHSGRLVTADDGWLCAHGVAYWMGPRSLPLWLPPGYGASRRRRGAMYRAAGGRIRPIEETVARTLTDERARGLSRSRAAGLERAEELALLAALQ